MIKFFCENLLNFDHNLNNFQLEIIDGFNKNQINCIISNRQTGSSTILSMLCIWYATNFPYSNVLFSTHNEAAKNISILRFKDLLRNYKFESKQIGGFRQKIDSSYSGRFTINDSHIEITSKKDLKLYKYDYYFFDNSEYYLISDSYFITYDSPLRLMCNYNIKSNSKNQIKFYQQTFSNVIQSHSCSYNMFIQKKP